MRGRAVVDRKKERRGWRFLAHSVLVTSSILLGLLLQPPPAQGQVATVAAVSSTIDDPAAYLPPGVRYARVVRRAPVYASLDQVRAGRPYTHHGGGDTWVNVLQSVTVEGRSHHLVRWNWDTRGWVSGEALSFTPTLSRLRGVDLSESPGQDLAMVYTDAVDVRSEAGLLTDEGLVGSLSKYDLVVVHERQVVDGDTWLRIADGQWVNSAYARELIPGGRPAGVGPDEKWIEVNVARQTIFAHEGDRPLFASLTSTGRPGRATVTGLFRPWTKLRTAPMRGAQFGLAYHLADVPWVNYFHGAFAWHGVYWRDDFGTPMSAGCVNLSPYDAHWFFHWSQPTPREDGYALPPTAEQPATWVYVHD